MELERSLALVARLKAEAPAALVLILHPGLGRLLWKANSLGRFQLANGVDY